MSTFGKKSLLWWDYQKSHSRENVIRYNHTPEALQLQILEKWYPIGMQVSVDSKYIYRIVSYVQSTWDNIFFLKLEILNEPPNRFVQREITKHPLQIKPLESEIIGLKRDIKLNKILDL